jgi:uncharacterized protein (TIGR03067 family)
MKLFRHTIAIVCIIAYFIADADESPTDKTKGPANQPTAVELELLQGTWEGVLMADAAHQKITITITGDSLHFHRDTNFWFETTIMLPAGKDPKQLHATIKDCPPSADSIGKVVRAFFKIEDGTLTLATMGDDSEESQKGFEAAVGNRYELRKVQKKKTEPPQIK